MIPGTAESGDDVDNDESVHETETEKYKRIRTFLRLCHIQRRKIMIKFRPNVCSGFDAHLCSAQVD